LGFQAWKDVMAFSTQPEGEYLRGLVNLVQEYGEETMLRAIGRCELKEMTAQVVCSTAHKAKGREWQYVRIDPDFQSGLTRASKTSRSDRARGDHQTSIEAEMRLLYVAITRAKLAVHLPSAIMSSFGLKPTTEAILGNTGPIATAIGSAAAEDSPVHGAVSPYHAPRNDDSAEMTALKRIFR
jgi:ATP-dependent exoDNAse (exonuclease V) beta subunit